jgi:hypothetical protein
MKKILTILRSLRFYQVLSAILFVLLLWLGQDEVLDWLSDRYPMAGNVVVEPLAPHAKEIKRILSPLKYSAIEHFMDPRTRIVIDKAKRVWGIRNLHLFDDSGAIVLRGGRFGVCGDLSAYVYRRIHPLFPSKHYSIAYLEVAESSFFNREGGTHIILEITEKSSGSVYYLDPSFRKYGSPDLFGGYLPKQRWSQLDFVEEQLTDQYFTLNAGPPVHINNKLLISLYVGDVGGKFDEDNFIVMLGALKRYEYASMPLLVCKNENGQKTVTDFNQHISLLMSRGVYDRLRRRVLQLCQHLEFTDQAPHLDRFAERKASNMHALSLVDTESLAEIIRKAKK